MKREALLVKHDTTELNRYLEEGWLPIFVSPQSAYGHWLVILEKPE